MSVAQSLRSKLSLALSPSLIDVTDESHRHAGHRGARPAGETHFAIRVVSEAFAGKSRIDRQRLIHSILAEELEHGIHALSIQAATPDEAARWGG
jgi:BolA protein